MPSSDEARELSHLKDLLRRKSVRFGEFTLVSGEKSDVYVDCKLTTFSPEAMPLVGRAFLRKMQSRQWMPEAAGGLTLGADPIAFAVARESAETSHPIHAFTVRKESKKHGMQRFIEGLDATEGLSVVVIDDVCTKGGSTATAIERILASGMRLLGAVCLVDREVGATEMLREKFGCELESVFKLSELRDSGKATQS